MSHLNLLTLTFGCMCAFTGSVHATGYAPRVGEPHPDFVLPDIVTGKPLALSQFRGKKVLLVHFSSW